MTSIIKRKISPFQVHPRPHTRSLLVRRHGIYQSVRSLYLSDGPLFFFDPLPGHLSVYARSLTRTCTERGGMRYDGDAGRAFDGIDFSSSATRVCPLNSPYLAPSHSTSKVWLHQPRGPKLLESICLSSSAFSIRKFEMPGEFENIHTLG